MGSPRGVPRVLAARLSFVLCALAAPLSLTTLTGCARCSDEPRVPFKLPGASQGAADAQVAALDAGPPAHVFEPPVDQPVIAGSVVAVPQVHAVLESDVDGDGDRDVLALAHDAQQEPLLFAALREPVGFEAPRAVTQFAQAPAPGCTFGKARLEPLSATKAVASLERTCGSGADPAVPRSSHWLLSLEATPRVFERIDLPGPEPAAPALRGRARSVDADGDGHDDVALDVMLDGAESGQGDALPLIWLDRPSGLVRDGREPDATLALWGVAIQALARNQPDFALARAQLALTLARAICRELGTPRLRFSGTLGVACGALPSVGTLLSAALVANVKRAALDSAFDAYRALRALEPPADAKLLQEATTALLGLRAAPGVTMRRITSVDVVRAPRVHLPSARFLSDASLYVRRSPPMLIDLDQNTETPAPTAADDLVRDPSGQLIAAAIERGCDGSAVRIERAPPRGSDYVSSPAVALASLTPSSAAAPATGCGRPSGRADESHALLGWAPQGLLVAHGSELRLVPLGGDGRPLGAPRVLAFDAPRPAPVAAGVATSDASRWVEATPAGVLVYGPRGTDVALLRPDGYAAIAKGPLEAAVSPTGRRVALVAGGAVYVLERP
ncbi:MAG: hypothetical protein ABW252_20625 [Polyangiales bacterium]